MKGYQCRTVPGVLIEPRSWSTPREFIIRKHPDPGMVGCVVLLSPRDLRDGWQEIEAPEPTDLERVLEAADAYWQEYGGRKLLEAILRVRAANQ